MCSCKKVIKGLDALLWNDLQIMLLNEKKKSEVHRAVFILPFHLCTEGIVYMRG